MNIDYETQLNKIKEAQKQSAIADLENTRNQALSDLEAERTNNAANFRAQRGQANVQNQLAARNFKEYLVNTGRSNSGIMPQYEMSRQNRLQANLNDINSGENMALADINRRGTLANQAYNTGLAGANANIESQYLTNLLNQQNEAWNRDMQQRQYDEGIRQFNENLALQQKKLEEEIRQYNENLALQKQQLAMKSYSGGSSGGSGGSSKKSSTSSSLSSNGSKLLSQLQSIAGVSGDDAAKAMVDAGARLSIMAQLQNAYYSGQITDNDLQTISAKFGL